MTHHRELFAWKEKTVNAIGICLKPKSSLLLTPNLLKEIEHFQAMLINKYMEHPWKETLYLIWYIDRRYVPSKEHLDFSKTKQLVDDMDYDAYIDKIFEIFFKNHTNLNLPIVSCSLLNKYVSGFSKEFFLLNKVCFLYDKQQHLKRLQVPKKISKLSLPTFVYENQFYYSYNKFDLRNFKRILKHIGVNILTNSEMDQHKIMFERAKYDIIQKLKS